MYLQRRSFKLSFLHQKVFIQSLPESVKGYPAIRYFLLI